MCVHVSLSLCLLIASSLKIKPTITLEQIPCKTSRKQLVGCFASGRVADMVQRLTLNRNYQQVRWKSSHCPNRLENTNGTVDKTRAWHGTLLTNISQVMGVLTLCIVGACVTLLVIDKLSEQYGT
jgi:hypothetical protein